jgi:hypothetical protein
MDVLGNDVEPNQEAMTLVSVSQPGEGSVRMVENNVEFLPPPLWRAPVTFSYTVSDSGGRTASGWVTISPQNPPVAVDDVVRTTGTSPVLANVLANDSDPTGEALAVIIVDAAEKGKVRLVGSQIEYTPPAWGWNGFDGFDYTIQDASGFVSTAHVEILPPQSLPLVSMTFDQTTGTTVPNLGTLGSAADGIVSGSAVWTGTALQFDGTSTCVQLGNAPGLNFDPASDNFTIMLTVDPEGVVGETPLPQGLVSKGTVPANQYGVSLDLETEANTYKTQVVNRRTPASTRSPCPQISPSQRIWRTSTTDGVEANI